MTIDSTGVLIVDDEPPARSRLCQLLMEIPGFKVVGEASHGEEALQVAHELHPDIVLLDIRMPGLDGLQVASHMANWEHKPAIIFTTAYDEYAIQAFDAQAIGYLLKPVRRERLQQRSHVARISLPSLPGSLARTQICAQRAACRIGSDQKYVTAHYAGGEALLDEPLKSLESEFGERFLRIHRNALVAVDYMDSLEQEDNGAWQVRLKAGLPPLAVSRRHVGEVKRRLRAGRSAGTPV
jgi:two-component system response regulator AlgR